MARVSRQLIGQAAAGIRWLVEIAQVGVFRRGHAAGAGLISIGLRALLLFGKFAFIVVLAKYTDTSTVGIYALLVTIVSITIYMSGLELHTFTGRELASEGGGRRGGVHIQNHLTTVVVAYVITLPIVWVFTVWLDIDGKFAFPLLSAIILFEIFGQELGRYLLMLSRPIASNVLQFLRGAAWMPIPITLFLVQDSTGAIEKVLWSWLAGSVTACMFGFWSIRGFLVPLHRFSLDWLAEAFRSSRHYFAVALLTQVQYYSDRFVVQYFMGEQHVGVLSFYQSFANTMIAFVQTGVVSIMLPRLVLAAHRDDLAAERSTRRSMFLWGGALAAGISVSLGIGMPFLLEQMNKAAYFPALPVFYILLLGNLVLVGGTVVHLSLYARRRDAELMRIALFVVPIGLMMNMVAVPLFGIAGAAVVFCAIAIMDLSAKVWTLRRTMPNRPMPDRPTAL